MNSTVKAQTITPKRQKGGVNKGPVIAGLMLNAAVAVLGIVGTVISLLNNGWAFLQSTRLKATSSLLARMTVRKPL